VKDEESDMAITSGWYKLFRGAWSDPKLAIVARRAESTVPNAFTLMVALFDSASEANDGGRFSRPNLEVIEEVTKILPAEAERLLSEIERIGITSGGYIVAWQKRQETKADRTAAERMRRHRAPKPEPVTPVTPVTRNDRNGYGVTDVTRNDRNNQSVTRNDRNGYGVTDVTTDKTRQDRQDSSSGSNGNDHDEPKTIPPGIATQIEDEPPAAIEPDTDALPEGVVTDVMKALGRMGGISKDERSAVATLYRKGATPEDWAAAYQRTVDRGVPRKRLLYLVDIVGEILDARAKPTTYDDEIAAWERHNANR
jgi:hypothetical protein